MVVRPSDWFLVDLGSDPTPGDAFGIRALAAKYADIATIAGDAADGVTRAGSSGAASAWVGDAGDIFREKSHRMPGELAKANDSYSLVAEALRSWAESVDDTQAQADRGLQQAREAHADLLSATAALGGAQSSWSTVHAQQLTYQKLQKDYGSVPPPANVTMPTDYQLRSADRSAQQAHASIAAAQSRIADADARIAAAKALVHAAKQRRDDAERAVVHKIGTAGDHAVQPSSIWEAIQSSAGWQVFVTVATVVLTIVSIVAIFVGGPLVWALILAATLALLADALMQASEGKDMRLTIVLLLVGLIPGGRGITSLARLGDAFSAGRSVIGGVGLMAKEAFLLAPKNAIIGWVRSLQQLRVGLIPGVVSMVRSIPNATRFAGHGPIEVIANVAKTLRGDYELGKVGAWAEHVNRIGEANPAAGARLSQANSVYSGVDTLTNTTLVPGQSLEVGAGGRLSGFGLPGGTAQAAGHDVQTVWTDAQVARNDQFGFRDQLFDIRPEVPVPAAGGYARANLHLGGGGGGQAFVPNTDIRLFDGRLNAVSVATGQNLPVTMQLVRNSADDVVDRFAVIHFGPGDTIPLRGDTMSGPFHTTGQALADAPSLWRFAVRIGNQPGEQIVIHQEH